MPTESDLSFGYLYENLVLIRKDKRAMVGCRTKDVVSANVGHDDETGWSVTLLVARPSASAEIAIPCADEREAGEIVDYVAEKMGREA